jgi:hypothetical protein
LRNASSKACTKFATSLQRCRRDLINCSAMLNSDDRKGHFMKKLVALLLATAMLGGCVVYPEGRGNSGGGYGKQCPPGQAKKGNC